MNTNRNFRHAPGLVILTAFLLLLAMALGGCSENSTSPTEHQATEAPALPDAAQLQFDFSFFDQGKTLDKASGEYDNFVNAYLRTVVLDAMAHLVLAAPIDAFAGALGTVPVVQPDGSWLWTYAWQIGPDPVTVALNGMPVAGAVQWNLDLIPQDTTDHYLWFSGTTNDNGEQGHWVFHDLDQEGSPVSGEISWGPVNGGNFLEFLSHEPDSDGDLLRFQDNDPDFVITFTGGMDQESSFIRWHASGEGSLQVPDYNDGQQACWDIYQQNVDCN